MDKGIDRRSIGTVLRSTDVVGAAFLLLASAALWMASRPLAGSRGFQFGPGTAPRLFVGLMVVTALVIIVKAFLSKDVTLFGGFALRAPACIFGAMFTFAFGIEKLGVLITGFLVLMLSSAATTEVRWKEATIFSVIFAAVCAGVFSLGLKLPMPLWPAF